MHTTKTNLDSSAAPDTGRTIVRQINRGGCQESFLMFLRRGGDKPADLFSRMDKALADLDGKVVRMDSIGLINTAGKVALQQRYCCDCEGCPLNAVGENGEHGCPVTGLYVNLIAGTKVEPVWLGGQIVGTIFEDEHARYCQLNEIHADPKLTPAQQTTQVFERMEAALDTVGMEFTDVARTWLFMDKILDWYDPFNRARDEFFKSRGIYDAMVPASTGIGGANSTGSAIVSSLTAVVPLDERTVVQPIASPLQGAAWDYGSSFSRAVEIATPDHKRVLISGTASIAESGETVYLDDPVKQVAFTMEVVEAILQSRGMEWHDVTRGAAYFRNFEDLSVYDRYCADNGLSNLPVAVVSNDVCRDDLLFEIEIDGVKAIET